MRSFASPLWKCRLTGEPLRWGLCHYVDQERRLGLISHGVKRISGLIRVFGDDLEIPLRASPVEFPIDVTGPPQRIEESGGIPLFDRPVDLRKDGALPILHRLLDLALQQALSSKASNTACSVSTP
jgi:hypothetical protein